MAKLLRAPTEGYAEAIVVPLILDEYFKLKHSLINMMTSNQFFGLEKDNPHDHIHLIRACPHHGFTELHQLDTFYNALNPADQDSLNSVAGGNLLERRTQDVLRIIENKSKVRNSRNKSIVSQVKSSDANSFSSSEIAKLTHAVNQQTSTVTTAMIAILKQFQATPPPDSIKAVEGICVTYGGAHPYYQCLAADGNTFPEFFGIIFNDTFQQPLLTIIRDKGYWGDEDPFARSESVKVSSACSSSFELINEGGIGMEGPSRTRPLRVVMAFNLPFGLAMVLQGRGPEPEVEAVYI
nr:hypothetical protein [Tanacetum cinerariifolium]